MGSMGCLDFEGNQGMEEATVNLVAPWAQFRLRLIFDHPGVVRCKARWGAWSRKMWTVVDVCTTVPVPSCSCTTTSLCCLQHHHQPSKPKLVKSFMDALDVSWEFPVEWLPAVDYFEARQSATAPPPLRLTLPSPLHTGASA